MHEGHQKAGAQLVHIWKIQLDPLVTTKEDSDMGLGVLRSGAGLLLGDLGSFLVRQGGHSHGY